jgi:hypothetical protein
MQATVSIPDRIFQDAERLAAAAGTSRSQLYALALQEYLARHVPDAIAEAMNRVCDEVGPVKYPFVSRAAEALLRRTEWQTRAALVYVCVFIPA